MRGHFHHRWVRLIAAVLLYAVGNILITLLISGKDDLLSWRGMINVIVSSVIFLAILAWLVPDEEHDDSSEDEKY